MAKWPQISIRIGADNSRLRRDFKKTETMSEKMSRRVKGAFRGMAAGLGAAAASAAYFAANLAMDGVKAAIEERKALAILNKQLKTFTKSTDSEIESNNKFIDSLQLSTGIADDELRPALARLTRSTKDLKEGQKLLNLAMDISAATGKPLETVANALGKAYDGNTASLGKLGIGIDTTKLKSMDFEAIVKTLDGSMGDMAETAAQTSEGSLLKFQRRWEEIQEDIGEKLLPHLDKVVQWAESPEGAATIESVADGLAKVFGDVATAVADMMTELTKGGEDSTLNTWIQWFSDLTKILSEVTGLLTTITDNELFKAGTFLQRIPQNLYDLYQASLTQPRPTYNTGAPYTPTFGNTTIVVNGALDPAASAKAIQRALQNANALGVSGRRKTVG